VPNLSAQQDLENALEHRFGTTVRAAKPKLESCPADGAYDGVVYCMTYLKLGRTYRFINASVNESQDTDSTAHFTTIDAWRRTWRKCKLTGAQVTPGPRGTLESNQPCDALPLNPVYDVMQEMGGAEHAVGFLRTVEWQFADSGPFAEAGMSPVAEARCGYKQHTITCSDKTGNSFRYTYH
jgi:hypothetical protein